MTITANNTTKSCWNKIGVWSPEQPTCEKLRDVVHCRNCEIFTNAGRDAFERAIPADYVLQWTQHYAGESNVQHKENCSIVVFRIGKEWFSLPTKYFLQIEETGFIHRIPHLSNQLLLGLVNIKGTVRLCFSLSELLGVSTVNLQDTINNVGIYQRFIVVLFDNQYFVFPVDEVGGVFRIDEQKLQQVPTTLTDTQKEMIEGVVSIKQKNIAVLAAQRVFRKIEELMGE